MPWLTVVGRLSPWDGTSTHPRQVLFALPARRRKSIGGPSGVVMLSLTL